MFNNYLNKYSKIVKQNIKGKVSLTTAVIVSLMITGQVSFAGGLVPVTNPEGSTISVLTYKDGIKSSRDEELINNGIINISGVNGCGMYSAALGNVTNNGTINISATAIGSYAYGGKNTNSGTITASGDSSYGMYSYIGETTNSGTVTASGDNSYGVLSSYTGNITNSGTVTASGNYSYGVRSNYTGNITNSGTVTASGDNSYGMYSNSSGNITNSGTVTASGDNSYGMYSNSAGDITNSGTVTASGLNSTGIYYGSRGIAITNTGTITAESGTYLISGRGMKNFTNDGTIELKINIDGADTYVPRINLNEGTLTLSDTGKIKFYMSGDASESSYDFIFGGTLTTPTAEEDVASNVISDGKLVAGDGTLEYNDELFVETVGWNVTDIDETGTETVVTLTGKDVYDELRETTQENNRTRIINLLDDDQDLLGIHDALANVSMDDAETAVTELSGEMHRNLVDEHIQVNKMFTGKINSMMSSPLTLRGQRQSDFALLLENSTAELSSDTFTLSPNYSFLEGEEKYIQHFDILGSTGSYDKSGMEYDTHSSGFIGITEKIIGDNSSVGISYGYFDGRNDYVDGSDSETETFHLGMTHKLYFGKDYMLASHLGAEYSTNDVTREITTLGLQANSDYDSYSVSIGTELNKNFELSERVTMVPSLGVGYSRIERESFTESGSIGLAALDVEKQGLDSVTSQLGLRFDVDLTDKIVWSVGGSWEHEYADLNKDQEASFKGDADAESFKIKGTNIDEDSYSILTGFNYNVNDSLTYRIMYSFTQQDDLGENNIDLGISWKF